MTHKSSCLAETLSRVKTSNFGRKIGHFSTSPECPALDSQPIDKVLFQVNSTDKILSYQHPTVKMEHVTF